MAKELALEILIGAVRDWGCQAGLTRITANSVCGYHWNEQKSLQLSSKISPVNQVCPSVEDSLLQVSIESFSFGLRRSTAQPLSSFLYVQYPALALMC